MVDGCRGHGLTSIAQALAALEAVAALPVERIALTAALHRALAAPARAAVDLPPFRQSAVDGYAVRRADLAAGALPLAGVVRAAPQERQPALAPGTAQRIYTGGMLPDGADTVVRQEWTSTESNLVRVLREVARGSDVREAGEELRAGAEIAPAGQRLTAGAIGALAAAGISHVTVHAAPRIAVLVTGDEVAPPGVAPRRGQVPDANGPLVTAWLAATGYNQVRLEYVADSQEAVRTALERAFAGASLVLTTGGVSVGDHDYVPQVARELGARALFWKVAQKPGKPVFAALRGDVPLLGLPGNPASVLVNLLLYTRRALDRLEGIACPGPVLHRGVVDAPVKADPERDQFLRMALSHDAQSRVVLKRLPKQASHMLSNLPAAQALAWIPASACETPAGAVTDWIAL